MTDRELPRLVPVLAVFVTDTLSRSLSRSPVMALSLSLNHAHYHLPLISSAKCAAPISFLNASRFDTVLLAHVRMRICSTARHPCRAFLFQPSHPASPDTATPQHVLEPVKNPASKEGVTARFARNCTLS
jgi:hypothetical protein